MKKRIPARKSAKSIRVSIIRHLRKWHRKLGILAAFFLIFLSLTGIGLNHTNSLGLAHQPIAISWLQDFYGIKNAVDIRFYQQKQLTVADGYIWAGDKLLLENAEPVIAAGKFKQYWLVLTASQLSIFNANGDLVDLLNSNTGLPSGVTGISITNDNITLNTVSGYFQTDENMLQWQQVETLIEPQWLSAEEAKLNEINNVQLRYKSQFLTLERFILDAHSGRILGDFGVYFMDLVAVILLLLSVSGIYLWIRHSRASH